MHVSEFDMDKSESNLDKHGIDFDTAQGLWNGPDFVEFKVQSQGESRFLVIGRIGKKHWSAIITYRDDVVRRI